MDKEIKALNIVFAVCDTLVCLAAVVAFGYAAFHFGKWWINLFNLLPLSMYSRHTVVVDHDLTMAQERGDNNA